MPKAISTRDKDKAQMHSCMIKIDTGRPSVYFLQGIIYSSDFISDGEYSLSFRDIALADRYKLLRSLGHSHRKEGGGKAATAYEVATKAIAWGYVDDRPIPDGAKYDLWIAKKNPPAWVAKSVARLLLDVPDYQPVDQGETYALALALVEALQDLNIDEIVKLVPTEKKSFLTTELFSEAFESRKQ